MCIRDSTESTVFPGNEDHTYELTVSVSDGESDSQERTFNVVIVDGNDAPTLSVIDDQIFQEGDSILIDARELGDPRDLDDTNAGLTFNLVNDPSGLFELDSDSGIITFGGSTQLPDNNDVTYELTISVSDDELSSDEATFNVVIVAANDAPTNSAVTLTAVQEDNDRIITEAELLANANDVDGDMLSVNNLTIASGNGSLADNGDGTWTYSPADNDDSDVSFSYDVTDGTDDVVGSATLDIVPVNDAPTNSAVTLTAVQEDNDRIITEAELLANANDVEGDMLSVENLTIVSGNGSLADNGDGTWTYSPADNDDSDVSFSYNVTDGSNNVAGSATLDIEPVNDAPTNSSVTLTAVQEGDDRIITEA